MTFCYVILHYKTEIDTIECIQSIFDSDEESQIVVVDNASNNGSIEKVEDMFRGNERVHVIKNSKNLGFASGNNVGYAFARNHLKADFIAVSNNDIIVKTKNFAMRVDELYKKISFYVMGPDIVSIIDGGHQNPMQELFRTSGEVKKEIFRYRVLLALSKVRIYDLLKPNRKVRTGSTKKEIPNVVTEDVVLHGSFMVFSPLFIEKEDISFREGTFLYTEEAILKRYCSKQRYKMIFSPYICVHHKEDSATNSLKLSNKERREFVFKNMIQSLSVYLTYFD